MSKNTKQSRLMLAIVTVLAMTAANVSYAQTPKTLTKIGQFLGFGDKSGQVEITPAQLDDVPQTVPDDGSLDVLGTQPNHLQGIDGVHLGKVPLQTIAPNTLKSFVQAVDLMRREYIYEVDDETLFAHAINGMLSKTDKNAEFLNASALANLQSFTDGNVAGVGMKATWQAKDNHWVVSEVAVGSPAALANIALGDYLHQIGEIKLNASHSENDIAQLLGGIAGTSVDVSFSRAGRSKQTVTLSRSLLEKSSVEVLTQNGVVIIKLPVFQNNTRQQILDSIAHIGTPVQGIVLDLRNNPGGVLESAVDVASLFMRKQVVTQVANRHGVERVLETQGSALFDVVPTIVLQNRYSASAAEVLASALQSQHRALIVGETSYGKGSIQSVIPIGNNQAVKLTTAHYLTPKGAKIDGVGVVPDVHFETVSVGDGEDWLQLTLNLMEQGKLTNSEAVEFSPVGGF